jgi:hypothetical protein
MQINEITEDSLTLFAKRNILNGDEIYTWAKQQGFTSALARGDMHVTIAFSKEPFAWPKLLKPEARNLTIRGGVRTVEKFGDAIVLCFPSRKLHDRWQEMMDQGASYDFPHYRSHVTISYQDVDTSDVKPYEGDLIFGSEKFDEIDEDWNDKIEEDDL